MLDKALELVAGVYCVGVIGVPRAIGSPSLSSGVLGVSSGLASGFFSSAAALGLPVRAVLGLPPLAAPAAPCATGVVACLMAPSLMVQFPLVD